MGRFVDNIIAYRILRLLTTPFEETDAFKLGIIDNRGRELKRMRDLHTDTELSAYSLLHRMVFRIKKIIEKVPIENKKVASYAAALALIRECVQQQQEPLDLELRFVARTRTDLSEEIAWVQENLNESPMLTFGQFTEDGETMAAPANNIAATPGIAQPDGAMIFGKRIVRRKKKNV